MTRELYAVGLNHKSAPVELREQLVIAPDDHGRVLRSLREQAALDELMVVSTCNRVEIYTVAAAQEFRAERALKILAELQRVRAQDLHTHGFVRAAGDAARHIFRVTASLESLVVGEPQILGQVKDAYERAKASRVVGPVLDRALSLAFKSAKRVRTETEVARGAANVSSVAVDLARTIFGDLGSCVALVLGAGEMAEQAAVHLRADGVAQIVVANRSPERGQALAHKIQGDYASWDRLATQLARADIVIASTGASQPVIDRALLKPVMRTRRGRPLFFVDIAVPRDVAADVTTLPQVFLYNVDDLQQIVQDNMRSRHGEAERAAALVEEEVGAFVHWMRTRSIGPLIGELQAYGREVVDAEMRRALARLGPLSPEQQAVVAQMGRGIMQKLLHRPMTNVRRPPSDGADFDPAVLAQAMAALFEIGKGPVEATGGATDARQGADPETTGDVAASLADPEVT